MGDQQPSASSKAGDTSTSSTEKPVKRTEMSLRSQSNPGATAMTRSLSESHATSTSTKERRPSKESLEDTPIDDDENDNNENEMYEEDEETKPTVKKRHSSSSHTNVYTECGRHGDDWLFGGISGAVKSVFGKK